MRGTKKGIGDMNDETVQNLIDSWQLMHNLTSPAAAPSKFGERDLTLTELTELSVLSGRKEYWDLFVCVLGYAEEKEKDHNQVLKTLAAESQDPQESSESAAFETYWNKFSNLSSDVITPTAIVIANSIARDGLTVGAQRMSVFEACRELHPNDPKKILECMRKRQGG
jgi:hypothetical protein